MARPLPPPPSLSLLQMSQEGVLFKFIVYSDYKNAQDFLDMLHLDFLEILIYHDVIQGTAKPGVWLEREAQDVLRLCEVPLKLTCFEINFVILLTWIRILIH